MSARLDPGPALTGTGAAAGSAPGGGFRGAAVAVIAYGVAMGYLEAAVVVYLRAALGLAPQLVGPGEDVITAATVGTFMGAEVAREAATLVMIAAVGWLAGRSPAERLAWAAVVFATWDITYYAGLWALIGWPESLAAWDVLFLIPAPWVGPVLAPVGVSVALAGFGLAAARRLRTGGRLRLGSGRLIVMIGGGLLVVAGFLVDGGRVLAGDLAPWSGWPLFAVGMTLAIAAGAGAFEPAVDRRPGGRAGD